ncbi:hypothetical protein BGP_0082 [Beggiatoa sp. PS]|nr:hypothetical protein BGP_0082 [Beggiatoa sp. PS]
MDFRYRLGAAITSHNPAVMLLVNGGEELRAEILQAVRYQQVEERLQKYNKASVNLTNILNWWSALSTSEQAEQENIDQLVSDTETALGSEFQEWTQQMQETMMALKEKDKIPEKSHLTGQKELSPPSLVAQLPKEQ